MMLPMSWTHLLPNFVLRRLLLQLLSPLVHLVLKGPLKKLRKDPVTVGPLPPDTDRARLVSESNEFQSRNQHLRYASRAKNIEANAKEGPTLLLQDIVHLLIKAGQVERGDFVHLSYNTTGK